jgi:hypothetical protein
MTGELQYIRVQAILVVLELVLDSIETRREPDTGLVRDDWLMARYFGEACGSRMWLDPKADACGCC